MFPCEVQTTPTLLSILPENLEFSNETKNKIYSAGSDGRSDQV
jgi:hypothetical protein